MKRVNWRNRAPTAAEVAAHAKRHELGVVPVCPRSSDNGVKAAKVPVGLWIARLDDVTDPSRRHRELAGWRDAEHPILLVLGELDGRIWIPNGSGPMTVPLDECRWRDRCSYRPVDVDLMAVPWPGVKP